MVFNCEGFQFPAGMVSIWFVYFYCFFIFLTGCIAIAALGGFHFFEKMSCLLSCCCITLKNLFGKTGLLKESVDDV